MISPLLSDHPGIFDALGLTVSAWCDDSGVYHGYCEHAWQHQSFVSVPLGDVYNKFHRCLSAALTTGSGDFLGLLVSSLEEFARSLSLSASFLEGSRADSFKDCLSGVYGLDTFFGTLSPYRTRDPLPLNIRHALNLYAFKVLSPFSERFFEPLRGEFMREYSDYEFSAVRYLSYPLPEVVLPDGSIRDILSLPDEDVFLCHFNFADEGVARILPFKVSSSWALVPRGVAARFLFSNPNREIFDVTSLELSKEAVEVFEVFMQDGSFRSSVGALKAAAAV